MWEKDCWEVLLLKEKIYINKSILKEEALSLLISDNVKWKDLKATGQMLVDSDTFSFVYLTEINEDYTYIVLDETIWPQLKQAKELKLPVYVVNKEIEFLLTNIHEELEYLTENIKGNGNYGESMVKKVESIF